jgi:hypothetical protein
VPTLSLTLAVPLAAHEHFDFAQFTLLEWALFVLESAITVWVLWLAVKVTLRPGEDAPDHVKRSILDDDVDPAAPRGPAPKPVK